MDRKRSVGGISCRSVGPGGTSVNFYIIPKGIKCIWTNENCPYGPHDEETSEEKDGSNVSIIRWEDLEAWLKHRPAARSFDAQPVLEPQPKKVLNKKKR